MKTVTDNALVGSLLSLALVMAIFIAGFGSLWLALATLLKLIIGLIFTAAFATLTVGEINFISVGFAMLYIGFGVEYAIHYCLYYKDLSRSVPLKACPSGLDPAPLPMSIFPKGSDLSSNALACAKHPHKPQLISNIGLKFLP